MPKQLTDTFVVVPVVEGVTVVAVDTPKGDEILVRTTVPLLGRKRISSESATKLPVLSGETGKVCDGTGVFCVVAQATCGMRVTLTMHENNPLLAPQKLAQSPKGLRVSCLLQKDLPSSRSTASAQNFPVGSRALQDCPMI